MQNTDSSDKFLVGPLAQRHLNQAPSRFHLLSVFVAGFVDSESPVPLPKTGGLAGGGYLNGVCHAM